MALDWGTYLSGAASAYSGGGAGAAQGASGGGGSKGGGGGGGYSGEISTDLKSGGKNTASFGAINFGNDVSQGGATTSANDSPGGGSNLILWVALGAAALFGFIFFIRR